MKHKCKLCGKEVVRLGAHIVHHHKNYTKQSYYKKFLDKSGTAGTCLTCGKETNFINMNDGFTIFCSVKCASNSNEVKQRKKQTTFDRYGVESVFQRKDVREKSKASVQSEETKLKRKKTNLERYGTENPVQSKKIQDKIKATNLERYGVENVSQSKEIRDKIKQNNLKKYGVENTFHLPGVQDKAKKARQSQEVIDKKKQTCLEKYGTEWHIASKDVRAKIKQTVQNRYGVDNVFSVPKPGRDETDNAVKMDAWIELAEKTKMKKPSKIEQYFMDELDKRKIFYEFQYYDARYPFMCDFYLPDTDTFIEINHYWMHGKHWFDENNQEDIAKLSFWKEKAKTVTQFEKAIQAWTVADPEKRSYAEKNNLNYVVLWNYDDVNKYLKQL